MKASQINVLAAVGGTRMITGVTVFDNVEYIAIMITQDAVFTTLEEAMKQGSFAVTDITDVTVAAEQNVVAFTIPAGTTLYPKRDIFKKVTLLSGQAIGVIKAG